MAIVYQPNDGAKPPDPKPKSNAYSNLLERAVMSVWPTLTVWWSTVIALLNASALWSIPLISVAVVTYLVLRICWPEWWLGLVLLVPAFLIFQQGMYVFMIGRKLRLAPSQPSGRTATSSAGEDYSKATKKEVEQLFGILPITVDYLLPALLAAIAGGAVGYVLVYIKSHRGALGATWEEEDIYAGIVLGAIGAYVYVVINLAQRSFLRDITPGVAVWSGAQLFLGPILGGFVAAIWAPGMAPSGYSHMMLYFFAGLAPREIVGVIQNAARRSLSSASAQQVPARLIPLQTISGIDQSVADRLLEEGIADGYQLAMANPLRLYRNTPYDLRQLLAWIDECLMIKNLPDYTEVLRKVGVTGATALAKLFDKDPDKLLKNVTPLAGKIGMSPELFKAVVSRLADDAQEKRVDYLFQCEDTDN